jgi:hypothetical protein
VLTGLILLAACVLTAIDAIQILLNHHPLLSYATLSTHLHHQHWNGQPVEIAAIILVALGVILLLTACLPGRPTVLALSDSATQAAQPPGSGSAGASAVEPSSAGPLATEPLGSAIQLPPSGVSRNGMRNMLRATVASVDGVTTSKLAMRRKVVAANVHSAGPPGDLADEVRGALEQRLDQIAPARRPALRVRASTRATS